MEQKNEIKEKIVAFIHLFGCLLLGKKYIFSHGLESNRFGALEQMNFLQIITIYGVGREKTLSIFKKLFVSKL